MHDEALFTWLHISDIHMGHGPTSHKWDQHLVLDALIRDVRQTVEHGTPRPDAILVTGDIAFSGAVLHADEYAEAHAWLAQLSAGLGLSLADVYLVPGNHDVQRQGTRGARRLIERLRAGEESLDDVLADPEDRPMLEARFGNYLAFASSFSSHRALLSWHELLKTDRGLNIRLIGLNTTLLALDDQDKGLLALGREQLARGLGSSSGSTSDIILVLSHHPFDWLSDCQDVGSWVQARAHVHLFGHVRKADSERSQRGAGSDFLRLTAGAVHGDAGEPTGHGYNVACVVDRGNNTRVLQVWPRTWSNANSDFRLDPHNVPEGATYSEHTLRTFGSSKLSRGDSREASPNSGIAIKTLAVVEEIRGLVSNETSAAMADIQSRNTFADDVLALLISSGLPFEMVENATDHFDVVLTPTQALFPQSHYVLFKSNLRRVDDINALLDRARETARTSTVVIVTASSLAQDVERYAFQRGVAHFLLSDFRTRILQAMPTERFIAGSLASEALARSFHIDEVYVPPDAVLTRPGDAMEETFYDRRTSAVELIQTFIENNDSKILCVLGGYGSGKSALAVHLVQNFGIGHPQCRAAYVSHRQRAYRFARMAAIRIRWRLATSGQGEPERGSSWSPKTSHPRGSSEGNSDGVVNGR